MLFQTVAVVAQVNISLGNPLFQVKKNNDCAILP